MLVEDGMIKNIYTPKTFKRRKQLLDTKVPKELLIVMLLVIIFLQFIGVLL